MRVNIYAEEQRQKVEIVERLTEAGTKFIGVRFYLKSHPDQVPPLHPDDDSPAVTFWVKSSATGYKLGDEALLVNNFRNAIDLLINHYR